MNGTKLTAWVLGCGERGEALRNYASSSASDSWKTRQSYKSGLNWLTRCSYDLMAYHWFALHMELVTYQSSPFARLPCPGQTTVSWAFVNTVSGRVDEWPFEAAWKYQPLSALRSGSALGGVGQLQTRWWRDRSQLGLPLPPAPPPTCVLVNLKLGFAHALALQARRHAWMSALYLSSNSPIVTFRMSLGILGGDKSCRVRRRTILRVGIRVVRLGGDQSIMSAYEQSGATWK